MKSALLLVLVVIPALVQAHGILVCPRPRAGQGVGNGQKITPRPPTTELDACAGSVAGAITATYKEGSTIAITWRTTIYHPSAPGVRIAVHYSTSDSFGQNILAPFGTDIGAQGDHTMNVTLPAGKTASKAIIQWVWDSQADGGYYLECADVAIVSTDVAPHDCNAPLPSQGTQGSTDDVDSMGSSATTVVASVAALAVSVGLLQL